MHPLARYAVPLGITLLVLAFLWWVFGPVISYVVQFWPALAIALGIAGVLWAFASKRVREAFAEFLTVPFTKGILIAVLLTAIYVGVSVAAYGPGAHWLQEQFGVDVWWARFWITVAIPFTIPAILRLYAATGLPGDPVQIGRTLRVFVVLVLVFLGWLHFDAIRIKAGEWTGGPPAAARPTEGIIRQTVPLLRSKEWTPIGHLIPACTRYTVESSGVREPKIQFADGSEERLGEGKEFGWRDPVALKGEGTAYLWLFEPGKSCRRT